MKTRIALLALIGVALAGCSGAGVFAGGNNTVDSLKAVSSIQKLPAANADAACGSKPNSTDLCALPYYRIRVDYLDQGDWTNLTVANPSKVIKVKELSMVGTPIVHVVDNQQISLNTQFGKNLEVVVDYALTPAAINSPFAFQITKGVAGTVTARISVVVGNKVTLVKQVSKQATDLNFTVNLSSLKHVTPDKAPIVDVPRMGMALYYPWYTLASWKSPVLIDHPLTPYASNNPADVRRQMRQAKSAGIDSFVVSWAGPGTQSDKNFAMMLNQAKGLGFKVGIFLEILDNNSTVRPASQLISWLNYLVSKYQNAPALLKVNGKLFAVPYLTDYIPLKTWATIRAAVRKDGHDVWLVEDREDLNYLSVFDGMWFDSTFSSLGPAVRDWSVLQAGQGAKMWIPTTNPGVDSRHIPGRNPTQYIPRNNGKRMRTMLAAAVTDSPNWIDVNTWNEWWENTYIEPSVNFGNKYLDITGDYLLPWIKKAG